VGVAGPVGGGVRADAEQEPDPWGAGVRVEVREDVADQRVRMGRFVDRIDDDGHRIYFDC
jgi:hypothetical protein